MPEGGEQWTTRHGGLDLRTLTAINVSELGPVSMPAHTTTTVGVRGSGRTRSQVDRDRKLVALGIVKPPAAPTRHSGRAYEERTRRLIEAGVLAA